MSRGNDAGDGTQEGVRALGAGGDLSARLGLTAEAALDRTRGPRLGTGREVALRVRDNQLHGVVDGRAVHGSADDDVEQARLGGGTADDPVLERQVVGEAGDLGGLEAGHTPGPAEIVQVVRELDADLQAGNDGRDGLDVLADGGRIGSGDDDAAHEGDSGGGCDGGNEAAPDDTTRTGETCTHRLVPSGGVRIAHSPEMGAQTITAITLTTCTSTVYLRPNFLVRHSSNIGNTPMGV